MDTNNNNELNKFYSASDIIPTIENAAEKAIKIKSVENGPKDTGVINKIKKLENDIKLMGKTIEYMDKMLYYMAHVLIKSVAITESTLDALDGGDLSVIREKKKMLNEIRELLENL